MTPSPKRPRAINGELAFGEEQKEAVKKEVLKRSGDQTKEGDSPKFQVSQYNSVRREMFNNLDDNQKRVFMTKAETRNKELMGGPERSIIFG